MLSNKKGFFLSFFVFGFLIFFALSIIYNLFLGFPVFSIKNVTIDSIEFYYGDNVDANYMMEKTNYNYPWFREDNIIIDRIEYEDDNSKTGYVKINEDKNSFVVNGIGKSKIIYKSKSGESFVEFNLETKFKNDKIIEILNYTLNTNNTSFNSEVLDNVSYLEIDDMVANSLYDPVLELDELKYFKNLEFVYINSIRNVKIKNLDSNIVIYCNDDQYNAYSKVYGENQIYSYSDLENYSLMLFDELNDNETTLGLLKNANVNLADYEPSRSGWTFKGWSKTKDGLNIINNSLLLDSNKKLYAVWEENAYNIKFNPNKPLKASNDVEGIMDVLREINYEQEFTLPTNNYSLKGWDFLGWSKDKDATFAEYSDAQTVARIGEENESLNLYAVWKEHEYNLSFDSNKPEAVSQELKGEMNPLAKKYDDVYNLPSNGYSLKGWTFKGWATNKDATDAEFSDLEEVSCITVTDNASVVLYAIWEENVYSYIFVPNKPETASNEVVGEMTNISNVNFEATCVLPKNNYSLTGWTFIGWGFNPSGQGGVQDEADVTHLFAVGGEIKLYALWVEDKYFIKFDSNKPSFATNEVAGEMNEFETVGYETFKNITSKYSLTGFTQVGWSTDRNADVSQYSNEDLIPLSYKNLNLYAVWKMNTYSIRYNSNKPETATGEITGQVNLKENIDYETKITLARAGYSLVGWTFKGWSKDKVNVDYSALGRVSNLAEDDGAVVDLYAIWEENKYNLVFNANKPSSATGTATGEVNTISDVYYETFVNLPNNNFVISDAWEFVGWSLDANSIVPTYSENGLIGNIDLGGNVSVYAIWRQTHFFIKFDSNKPSGATNDVTGQMLIQMVAFNDASATIQTNNFVINDHWKFVGWEAKEDSTKQFEPNCSICYSLEQYKALNPDSDCVELNAVWDLEYFNLTIYNNIENVTDTDVNYREYNDVNFETANYKQKIYQKGTIKFYARIDIAAAKLKGWSFSGSQDSSILFDAVSSYKTRTEYSVAYDLINPNCLEDIELYEIWQQDTYVIKYFLNNPSNNIDVKNYYGGSYYYNNTSSYYQCSYMWYADIDYDNYYSIDGYTFVGWTDDKNSSTPLSSYKERALNDSSLYAVWSQNEYSIKFNPNKPSNASSDVVGNMADINCHYEDNLPLNINEYTLTGWKFRGWSYSSSSSSIDFANQANYYMLAAKNSSGEEVNLYAVWEPNTYYVIFDKNNEFAIGSMDVQIFTYDIPQALNEKGFTSPSYTFSGWLNNTYGGNYSNCQVVNNLTTVNEDIITLKAQWDNSKYSVHFNLNAPSNSSRESSVVDYKYIDYETDYTIDVTPTIKGFKFSGWLLNGEKVTELNYQKSDLEAANYKVELYATWEQKTYQVNYVASRPVDAYSNDVLYKGGSLYTTEIKEFDLNIIPDYFELQVKYNSVITYEFLGWAFKDGNAYTSFNSAEFRAELEANNNNSDIIYLYPKFRLKTYTISFASETCDIQNISNITGVRYMQLINLSNPTATKVGSNNLTYVGDNEYYYNDSSKIYSYIFGGWYNDSDYYVDELYFSYTSNITLTAKWYNDKYSISVSLADFGSLSNNTSKTNDLKISGGSGNYNVTYNKTGGANVNVSNNNGWKVTISGVDTSGTITVYITDAKYTNYRVTTEATYSFSCFAEGTNILMADGTYKKIEELKQGDLIMSWNFVTGKLEVMPISLYWYHGTHETNIINLHFDNSKVVKVITTHGFFDYNLNKFVYITEDNYNDYIGHEFISYDEKGYSVTKLLYVQITKEEVGIYSLRTACNDNAYAEGLLSLTAEDYEGFLTYFEVGENMKYDQEKVQEDIEKYGLVDYNDWKDYVSYEEFIALNGQYFNVLIGKGIITFEDIFTLIEGMRLI